MSEINIKKPSPAESPVLFPGSWMLAIEAAPSDIPSARAWTTRPIKVEKAGEAELRGSIARAVTAPARSLTETAIGEEAEK